jgi:hypothetical protein
MADAVGDRDSRWHFAVPSIATGLARDRIASPVRFLPELSGKFVSLSYRDPPIFFFVDFPRSGDTSEPFHAPMEGTPITRGGDRYEKKPALLKTGSSPI